MPMRSKRFRPSIALAFLWSGVQVRARTEPEAAPDDPGRQMLDALMLILLAAAFAAAAFYIRVCAGLTRAEQRHDKQP